MKHGFSGVILSAGACMFIVAALSWPLHFLFNSSKDDAFVEEEETNIEFIDTDKQIRSTDDIPKCELEEDSTKIKRLKDEEMSVEVTGKKYSEAKGKEWRNFMAFINPKGLS